MQRKNAAEIDQYCWIYAEELAEEIPVYLLHKVVKKYPGQFLADRVRPVFVHQKLHQ